MSELCERLPWDSDFFGVAIARARVDVLTAETADAIDAWCARERIACLYFLARCDDPTTVEQAQAHGHLHVDTRVTFERAAGGGEAGGRLALAGDREWLRSVARRSYRDTRFYFDPRFPDAKADALYERWIDRSCDGWATVFVVENEGRPAGFISCHVDEGGESGSIGLVGVDEHARGRGVGLTVVRAALAYFEQRAVKRVTVVTQARNVAAQRLYQRCGFLTKDVQLYYHKWYQQNH